MNISEVRTSKTTLPVGLYARPVELKDLEPMVNLFDKFTLAQAGLIQNNIDSVRSEWTSPMMNLAKNTMGVFTANHQPVGYMEFWNVIKPPVKFSGWIASDPDYAGQGIEEFLVDWLVERAKNEVPYAPEDTRVVLQSYINSGDEALGNLLTSRGFEKIRVSYTMRINFNEPPQPAILPEGVVIRHIENEAEQRAAIYCAWEAFKDHWGFVDEPFDSYYQRYRYFSTHDPDYDPSLWFIALDGDEVAGISLCRSTMEEDPEMGWVNTLGVRRPWRKRGVGLALLQHSFYVLNQRGKPRVGLGVDASSLTGATRLYERAGMRVLRSMYCYEYELRAGRDLMTQNV